METKKRAGTYIRVSGKEQATEDKASLEVQQRDCEAYCRRKGYDIVHSAYVDIQSGTDSRKERVAFEQMLEDASRGAFDTIVAWRPDRLFRSLWPAARLKQVMDTTGVDVETVTQPMDKSTLGLWAWVAEREIQNIRERTMMGRESLARAGKLVTGNPPYGFKYDPSIKQLKHDDQEKPQVLGIFNWVVQGKSIGSLVTDLNRLGFLTRYGKPWSRQQIVKMLKNPIYVGRAYWGKRERRSGLVVAKKSVEERILIPVIPIVAEEIFESVQRQLEKNRRISPRNTKAVHMLQHLLWCRSCGKPLGARSRNNRFGKPLNTPERLYGCRGMKQSPGAYYCRKTAELNAATLENVVWNEVTLAFAEPEALLKILKARNAGAVEKALTIRAERDSATEQLGKKNLELQQVLTYARQNLLSADELKPQLAQVREQKQHWEEEIRRLKQKLGSLKAGAGNLADAEKLCLSIRERAVDATLQQKKEFLRLVVECIWVDESNNLDIEVVIPKFEKQPTDVICETPLSFKGEREGWFLKGLRPFKLLPPSH
jgi:site-specific DNA recombinase